MADNIYSVNLLGSTSGVVINDDGMGIDEIRITGTYAQRTSIRLDWTTSPSPSARGTFFPNSAPDNTSISLTINGIIENARGSNGGDDIQGNQFANIIYGDAARTGPGGNDVISAGDGDDTVYGGAGSDSIGGGGGNDRLYGDDGVDTINGNAGIDIIEGGAGADTLSGGSDAGDMVSYASSNAGVTINITHGSTTTGVGGHAQGDKIYGFTDVTGSAFADVITDTVKGTIAFGYNNNKFFGGGGNDRLYLGGGNDVGYGGNGNDMIYGEAGNDRLDGGAGADYMAGGVGNDIYYVDNVGDKVIEANGAGTDLVYCSVSQAFVSQFIEKITLTGSAHINTTGNALANIIVGNTGQNAINGREGNDTLTGGAGNDSFVFNTALNAATNVDNLVDFSVVNDSIILENAIFTNIIVTGTLTAAQFTKNASGVAMDANDRIIYETDTGKLFYDSNGSAAGGSVQFAKIAPGLLLTANDFFIV